MYEDASATTSVAELTNPTSVAVGKLSFTAPADTILSASTTYYVLVSTRASYSLQVTEGNDEDSKDGWSIGDSHVSEDSSSNTATVDSALKMEVHGKFNAFTDDATLESLALSEGTLDPEFDADVIAYTAAVPNATERITVTAVKASDSATFAFLDLTDASTDAGFQVDLSVARTP